jgi:hypothetical protein
MEKKLNLLLRVFSILVLSLSYLGCEESSLGSIRDKFLYNCDESTGSTLINESGNKTYNGELFGVSRAKNKGLTHCLEFIETGAYVQLPGLGKFESGEISIEFLINPDEKSNLIQSHIIGDGFGGITSFKVILENGILRFFLTDINQVVGWFEMVKSKTTLTVGEWHYVAVVYNGNEAKIYIDGDLDNSKIVSYSIAESANIILIGDGYYGFLDEIKIYEKATHEKAIKDYFNQLNLK